MELFCIFHRVTTWVHIKEDAFLSENKKSTKIHNTLHEEIILVYIYICLHATKIEDNCKRQIHYMGDEMFRVIYRSALSHCDKRQLQRTIQEKFLTNHHLSSDTVTIKMIPESTSQSQGGRLLPYWLLNNSTQLCRWQDAFPNTTERVGA